MCMYCIHTNNNTNVAKTRNVVTLRVPTSEKQGEKNPSSQVLRYELVYIFKKTESIQTRFSDRPHRPEGKMRRNASQRLVTIFIKCSNTPLVLYGHTYSKSMGQPGKVASPARGQLNRKNEYFPVRVRAREYGLVRRVRQSRPASA